MYKRASQIRHSGIPICWQTGAFDVWLHYGTNICVFSTTASTYGYEFFVAVPEAFGFFITTQLIIGTPSSDSIVGFTVNATDIFQTGQVSFNNPAVVTIDYFDLAVVASDFNNREKGVYIRATEAPIFVIVTTDSAFFGFGDYLAFPRLDFQQESYEYFAVSTSSQVELKSQVILVGTVNDTQITIFPTVSVGLPEDAQDETSPMVVIAAGNNHTVTLNQRQTLLVFSDAPSADLTGTKIVANKPLTVISGHQCGNVPESFSFCEQLAVQVPPTLTWGTEFLLAPFDGRTTGQYYKVVAAEDNTAFLFKCGTSNTTILPSLAAGGSQLFSTDPNTYCYLTSQKPVFVVQLATGGSTSTMGDNLGDPVMAIVSPTHQYTNRVVFIAPQTITIETHFISVTVGAEDYNTEDILFDDLPIQCVWIEIQSNDGSIIGYGCTLRIIAGSHTISHNKTVGRLSVLAYGFDPSPLLGYAFIAGMEFNVPDEPSTAMPGTCLSIKE